MEKSLLMRRMLLCGAMGLLMTSSSAFAATNEGAPHHPSLRPVVLPALYASFAFLEGFDVHATITAINAGAVEENPMMKSITRHPAPFIALKTGPRQSPSWRPNGCGSGGTARQPLRRWWR